MILQIAVLTTLVAAAAALVSWDVWTGRSGASRVPLDAVRPPSDATGMIRIYGARDPIEAEFVKGLFEAEGIAAVVQGNALQTVLGDVPPTPAALPSVWVNEADVDRARLIVDEMGRGGPAAVNPQPAWTCPACGTQLEGQFTTCWKCGTERAPAMPAV